MKREDMKTGVVILATFIFGGVLFRHGNDILDAINVYVQNIFAYKNAKISGDIEKVKIDLHKRWSVTNAEFPVESGGLANPIGFDAGDFMDEGFDGEDYE